MVWWCEVCLMYVLWAGGGVFGKSEKLSKWTRRTRLTRHCCLPTMYGNCRMIDPMHTRQASFCSVCGAERGQWCTTVTFWMHHQHQFGRSSSFTGPHPMYGNCRQCQNDCHCHRHATCQIVLSRWTKCSSLQLY